MTSTVSCGYSRDNAKTCCHRHHAPTNIPRKSFVTNVETTGTTTTATSTSSVATYTVPTPAGFTPIASGPGYVPKKRSLEMAAAPVPAIRGRSVEERAASRIQVCPEVGRPGSFSQYPQTVICGALVIAKTTSTRTYTATSTVSTTLPVVTNTITVSHASFFFQFSHPFSGALDGEEDVLIPFHRPPPLPPKRLPRPPPPPARQQRLLCPSPPLGPLPRPSPRPPPKP